MTLLEELMEDTKKLSQKLQSGEPAESAADQDVCGDYDDQRETRVHWIKPMATTKTGGSAGIIKIDPNSPPDYD